MTRPKADKAINPASSSTANRSSRRGPGRPTRSEAQQRDMELLDVALDLFYERGFEGTTIDAITAACNMAKRTVYARYEDKTTLFKAALQRAIEQWIVPVERLRAEEDDDLEASLIRIGRILVDNILSPAGQRLLRITNAEAARMPEIGAHALKCGTKQTLDFLADLFRRRIREEDPAAPFADDAAHAFTHLVVGGPASMRAWGIQADDAEIERQSRFCVHLFLNGVVTA